jgi:hypothetical protein
MVSVESSVFWLQRNTIPGQGKQRSLLCSAVLKDGSAWTGEPYSQSNALTTVHVGPVAAQFMAVQSGVHWCGRATEQAPHASVRTSPQPPLHLDIPPNTSTARGGRRRQGQGSTWIARSRKLPRWLPCSIDRVPSKLT